jgi:hypothetical protein
MLGKRKGNSYERTIAEKFTQTFKLNFRRTPCSGGWDKSIVTGDLFTKEYFALNVECKNVKSISIRKWMIQSTDDAGQSNKVPCVVFHINRCKGLNNGGNFVCMFAKDMVYYIKGELEFVEYEGYENWKIKEWLIENKQILVDDFAIIPLDIFLTRVNRKRVKHDIWRILQKYLEK